MISSNRTMSNCAMTALVFIAVVQPMPTVATCANISSVDMLEMKQIADASKISPYLTDNGSRNRGLEYSQHAPGTDAIDAEDEYYGPRRNWQLVATKVADVRKYKLQYDPGFEEIEEV